jgi:hypothetical protein
MANKVCRFALLLGALGAATALSCGRSPVSMVGDGDLPPGLDAMPLDDVQHGDVAPLDGSLPWDGPCNASCIDMCKLLTACTDYPGGPPQCLNDCPAWSEMTHVCLRELICDGGGPDCQDAMACLFSPPKPDLVLKNLNAPVNGTTVKYTFEACNQGKAPAGPFPVDLTYDSPTPPQLQQAGDQAKTVAGLAAGACIPMTFQRTKTPDGSYSSWVQLDGAGVVPESDEQNNVAGPVSVTVKAPPKPDLIIKQFDVQLSGSDIVYTAEVCNVGTVQSFLFRLEIYYTRLLAPSAFMIGDVNKLFLLGLGAGACKTVTHTYKNAPVGLYNSWAQVDALNTVAESDESNNVAGPKLVTVQAASGCMSLCILATTCGEFSALEFSQCLTWCSGMDPAAKQCAQSAAQAGSCSDLASCTLPPKPPDPPPPWACLTLCNYLIDTCNLIPSDQNLTCIAGCITLPSTKIQCGWTAMDNAQCTQLMLCIL